MLMPLLLAAAAPLPNAWAWFERAGALSHIVERVYIATAGADPATHRLEYRVRLLRIDLRGRTQRRIESRTCPAIRPMLASLRDLPMPKPAPYGVGEDNRDIVVDGTAYLLHVPSTFSNGGLTITSNVGSPLAGWVDGALKTLAACPSPPDATAG